LEGLDDGLGVRAEDAIDLEGVPAEGAVAGRAGERVEPTLQPLDDLALVASA
jgi:hypothetical protein